MGVVVAVLVFPGLVGSVPAQVPPPDVTVSVDRQSATVGDPITLVLRVRYDSTLHLTPFIPGGTVGPFTVLSDSTPPAARSEGSQAIYERHWRLAIFEPGDHWIPAFRGRVVDTTGTAIAWQSDSVAITIESVLTAADDSADIRGLKGAYVARQAISAWWYALAAALALLALVLWLRWRRRVAVVTVGPPPVPPWDAAMAALDALPGEIDPDLDGGRLWYFRLSEILRRYLDGRYDWQTIDQTTTEILRQLGDAPFNGDQGARVKEFLSAADLVRYARSDASVGRPELDREWMREFVVTTRLPQADIASARVAESPEQTAGAADPNGKGKR